MAKKKTKNKKVIAKAAKAARAKEKGKVYGRVIGRWGGHKFVVSNKKIESFSGLTVKGSCDVETKKKDGQKYSVKKTGNAVEISLNVLLNAYLGSDVRKEAMKWVKEAKQGKQSYFYVGKKKLVASKLVLKSANVKDIELSSGGKWVNATVAITLEQSTKKNSGSSDSDGSGGGGGGGGGGSGSGGSGSGSNKQSVRTTSPVKTNGSWLTDQQKKNMEDAKPKSNLTDQQQLYINQANQKKKQDEEAVRRARQKGLP